MFNFIRRLFCSDDSSYDSLQYIDEKDLKRKFKDPFYLNIGFIIQPSSGVYIDISKTMTNIRKRMKKKGIHGEVVDITAWPKKLKEFFKVVVYLTPDSRGSVLLGIAPADGALMPMITGASGLSEYICKQVPQISGTTTVVAS